MYLSLSRGPSLIWIYRIVVIAAKSTSDAYASTAPFPPDPNSPASTISTVEREIKESGNEALAIAVDVRDYSSIQKLVQRTVEVSHYLKLPIHSQEHIERGRERDKAG